MPLVKKSSLILLALAPSIALAFSFPNRSNDAPVPTGPPNASNQEPAFPEQTRAPERRSNFSLNVTTVAEGFNSPWALEFMPDGNMLITERGGTLRIVSKSGAKSAPIQGLPAIAATGQGGLMDVLLSENFARDREVYFSYAEPRGGGANATAVARGTLNQAGTQLSHVQVIFQQQPPWQSSRHFGSRLAWGADGTLFITTGERSDPEPRQYAQDLQSSLGKVIRINPDGTAPSDNPYAGTSAGLDEIWSYGHRNIQGIARHPGTDAIWSIEHGPRGGDEINIPEPGKNYGWPIITYGEDYSGAPIGDGITQKAGLEQPVYYWDPVIAPASMTFYQGTLFPSWNGDIFIASLNPGGVVRLELDGNQVSGEERLVSNLGRVRDVMVGDDGALWVLTDSSGRLVRISR